MKSSARSFISLVLIYFCNLHLPINGSLVDITENVFGSNANGILAAFGDFNSDKLTDVFMITNKGKELQVFLASNEPPYLKPSIIKCNISSEEGTITGVAPGDFNGDSQMDVLIVVTATATSISKPVSFRILWGYENNLNCTPNSRNLEQIIGQPLLLDYNGDKLPDVLAMDAANKRKVWKGSRHNITSIDFPGDSTATFRNPHSHTFIDLNADMVPDLLLSVEGRYEIWHNENGSYVFKKEASYADPPGSIAVIGQSIIFDSNLDGTMDHLVPVCYDPNCFNSSILIRKPGEWVPIQIGFEKNNIQWGFVPPRKELTDLGKNTLTVRVGDYDFDGYPDLLAVLRPNSESEGNKAFLMHNEECGSCTFGRKFSIIWDPDGLQHISDVILATFYDVYNDGILDILVVHHTSTGDWGLSAFQNNYDNNACFIKVIVLSGLCYTDCPNKKLPYGVNQPGPSVCYNTTTIEGAPQASCAGQLSQSAYFSLQLPYVVFGLGHTPNFVDTLHVGVPSLQVNGPLTHSWPSIIPNSQMFVIPNLSSDGNRWINKLFVTPSQLVLITFAALMGAMGLILLIILGLHIKERREDKKEKLQESHRFHFDAM